MKYFDTHAHITTTYYEEIDSIISKAKEHGVNYILIPATTKKDVLELSQLSIKGIKVAYGIHPSEAIKHASNFLNSFDLSHASAIGEIGIDLYHKTNPPLEIQIAEFKNQLNIALKYNLPVLIHMRDAEIEVYKILSSKHYQSLKIIMHSFASSLEWAYKFITLGAYISFSGIVTFKNALILKEVAKIVPLNRILVETDSPFLTPTPNRGKKNEPINVIDVANCIADLREEENNIVISKLYTNAKDLFI